ncbi:CPBP family intramembrane glutamic endopeptidase [Tunicatimonas pelagia]|uniref:CPBP family intramembrane glutamic endopeptidase n=1 Tax=Tunicatimonas pelagia TaxID=931531 RepID=UPI0026665CF2|nr:CPBP family intramembrane glutamic endopeptidase [Tunicatimonas pelagia]WKN41533.1 CPBP family intramembrane metalloprotease [Tunicatimonas pelagia]
MDLLEEPEPTAVRKTNIVSSLLILVGFVLLGLFIGQILAFIGILPLFDYDFQNIQQALANPMSSPRAKSALLILQAATSLFGFVLAPLLHYRLIDRQQQIPLLPYFSSGRATSAKKASPLAVHTTTSVVVLSLVFLLMLAFMVANSVIIEWNMNLDFSGISPAFEAWAQAKEDKLKELTEYLTRFNSISGLLIGMVVIAVLPAVGEELLFRGLVQPKLHQLVGNHHAAIWLAALLFSAIHMQFYGFFPRLLLGALFGYLFYWSGNLWYAIFAHFVNNGFTLVMLYLYQQEITDIDLEATEAIAWPIVLAAAGAGVFLLYQFRQMTKLKQPYG